MIDLRTAARALAGDVVAGGVVCPGPNHRARDRSLYVRFDPRAPEGFVVNSFAGDDPMECRDAVRSRLGLASWRPGRRDRIVRAVVAPTAAPDAPRRIELAARIWREAVTPAGTIVERYLAGRGLHLPSTVIEGGALRFHGACPFGQARLPAMVAVMVDPVTNRATAIHRTALSPDGNGKAEMPDGGPAKRWLGVGRGAVITLTPNDAVTSGLGIAEGIETGLTVLCAGWAPVWAAGSATNLAAFPVLSGIDALTIFADRGEAGERAAATAAARWVDAGNEAEIRLPFGDDDFNEAWEGDDE